MRVVIAILFSFMVLYAESFADYKSNNSKGFKEFTKEFDKYKATIDKEFKNYKAQIAKSWKNPELSSAKKWVEYSKDNLSRKSVDFNRGEVTIEVISSNAKKATAQIAKELIKTTIEDTKTAQQNDELAQRIAKKLSSNQRVEAKPILAPILLNGQKDIKSLVKYAKTKIQQNGISKSSSKLRGKKVYKLKIKLPKNYQRKLALNYKDSVLKESKEMDIDPALIYAIIQTESNFNPRARSHIPAFGLMQIVPRSAGVDAYKYLYGSRKILSPSYLYNENNNIKIGTTYLHILNQKYLKGIKDYKSRLYCTIAGYNTGAGNIAYAFNGSYNIKKAIVKINSMSSNQVYKRLLNNLKYQEAKNYLKRVSSRMKNY